MQNHTFVPEPAQVAFFFAVVSSYASMLSVSRRALLVAGPPFLAQAMNAQLKTSLLSKQQFPSSFNLPTGNAPKTPVKGKLSAAGDWLVPIIVWVLVIMMSAAIVGFLLGDR